MSYLTVEGLRYERQDLARIVALRFANRYGRNVTVRCFDDANPYGFDLFSVNPGDRYEG